MGETIDEPRKILGFWPWRDSTERLLLGVVQICVLIGIIYSTWHFGAVQAVALRHLSWIVAVGLLAALPATLLRSESQRRLPTTLWILLAIWIVYSFAQATPMPSPLNIWFSRAQQQSDTFRDRVDELAIAAEKLGQGVTFGPKLAAGSASREVTYQATAPYILALAFSVLAAIGFERDRPRKLLLWTIVINASLMAIWGIIQRSGGGTELLPGIENRSGGIPFGSFVYKNAGAAALLPAIVCLVAILLMLNPQQGAGLMSRGYSSGNRKVAKQLGSLFVPGCLFLSGILITGLIASASRGAWLAALLTTLVIGGLLGVRSLSRRVLIVLAGVIALMIAVVTVTGITGDIQHHVKRLSVDSVSGDSRWDAWSDGFQAAIANLPSGTGLGTYGYATLPFQTQPRREWFRDAHNQYLETLTETGLIGLTVVVVTMIWFGRTSYRLLRSSDGRIRLGSSRLAWGMVGVSLLLFGTIQNTFDFVIKIPAILLLYSVLGTVVATTRLHSKSNRKRRPAIRTVHPATARPTALAIWTIVSLCGVVAAERITYRQICADRALEVPAGVEIADGELFPPPDDELKRLEVAIVSQPGRADLYLQRARCRERQYQRQLIVAAGEMGYRLTPQDSRILTIHAILATAPPERREELKSDFIGNPELRKLLGQTIADLHTAVLLNPYDPRVHFHCALVSQLGEYSIDPWLGRSAALSNNNDKLLFDNGLLSHFHDDHERMFQQWSRSLTFNHHQMQTILDLAATKVSITEVVRRLVPDNRPDRVVALVKRYRNEHPGYGADRQTEEILDYVKNSTRFDPAKRLATLAGLNDMLGRNDMAINHWRQSVRLQPTSPNFRLSLVDALRRFGRPDDALDQAVLGQRLFPSDRRFEQNSRSIRRNMLNR